MDNYTAFVQTEAGSIRYCSGCMVYDEMLIHGRLIGRYMNPTGQILPEMHLHPETYSNEENRVFSISVAGQALHDGWCCKGIYTDKVQAIITLQHRSCPIELEIITHADGKGWMTRSMTIRNCSDQYLPVDYVAPFGGSIWNHRFDNGILSYSPNECDANDHIYSVGYAPMHQWGREGDFGFHPLKEKLVFDGGMHGRSGWSRPAYVLEDRLTGQLLCCELAYSGNWKMQLNPQVSSDRASLRHEIGLIAPEGEAIRVLAPGEKASVPAVHFTLCAEGREALIHARHRFIREKILPQRDPIGKCLVEANHRGYLCDRENEDGIKRDISIAAKAGAELYVIDAGWYGEEPNVWFNNVGDWFAGKWLPNDLYPIIAHARSLGMKFGLWMEFEAAGANSRVRKEHPEFFMKRYGKPVADGRALDLSQENVLAWIEAQITDVIGRYRLDMFRIDHNHYIEEGGTRIVGGHVENVMWRYMENLYAMLSRLNQKFPNVSFQNCAAGGGRLDLGIMRFFHHTEISDWARPPREMRIFNGMLAQLPPEIQLRISGTEVCEHVQDSDMISQMHSIMQGRMIFRGIAPSETELSQPLLQMIVSRVKKYKEFIRPILIGDCLVFRHDDQNGVLDAQPFSANEFALPDRTAAFAVVHRLTVGTVCDYTLRLRGVRYDMEYEVVLDRAEEACIMQGRQLAQDGLLLHMDHCLESELILVRARHISN